MPAEIDVLPLQVFHLPFKPHGLHHRAMLLFSQCYSSRSFKKSVDKGASLLKRRQTVEQFGILFTCCAEIHHNVAVNFREGLPDTFREIGVGFMTYFDAQGFGAWIKCFLRKRSFHRKS